MGVSNRHLASAGRLPFLAGYVLYPVPNAQYLIDFSIGAKVKAYSFSYGPGSWRMESRSDASPGYKPAQKAAFLPFLPQAVRTTSDALRTFGSCAQRVRGILRPRDVAPPAKLNRHRHIAQSRRNVLSSGHGAP